ncbi:hypothetical protein [Ilumatobacter nonamiensis]|uniref:hypothetical protein n=1 Tax=Ilumatobacter nonamiensis TaxID=467093 RepID=UPI00034BA48A|nr:hypothetical protein [Ilumatobacter nonamiensis]
MTPSRDLDDWIVLFDGSTAREVELLGAAGIVYRLIGSGRPESDVLADVAKMFTDEPDAVEDARGVIDQLVAEGLLVREY